MDCNYTPLCYQQNIEASEGGRPTFKETTCWIANYLSETLYHWYVNLNVNVQYHKH